MVAPVGSSAFTVSVVVPPLAAAVEDASERFTAATVALRESGIGAWFGPIVTVIDACESRFPRPYTLSYVFTTKVIDPYTAGTLIVHAVPAAVVVQPGCPAPTFTTVVGVGGGVDVLTYAVIEADFVFAEMYAGLRECDALPETFGIVNVKGAVAADEPGTTVGVAVAGGPGVEIVGALPPPPPQPAKTKKHAAASARRLVGALIGLGFRV